MKAAPSWECEAEMMNDKNEIVIPAEYAEALLRSAAEKEVSVEEVIEACIRKYIEGRSQDAG